MTTIRVLFLTGDTEYCHRLAPYFAKYHPEIKPAFSASEQSAAGDLERKMYNVVLIGEEFAGSGITVPGGVSGAYISENSAESEINGLRSFCKYKSGEALYRIILSMFAEVSNVKQFESHGNKIFAFIGANGGSGATTMAAAFAYRQSSLGKKTLYFSCDQFSDYSGYFSDNTEGGTLSDLVFIVKTSSDTGNASLKAAALLKKDASGVKFLENIDNPYDFDNLTTEHIEKMLNILSGADEFDCVVIDASFLDSKLREFVIKKADMLFIVSENNPGANAKLRRTIKYLKVLDEREKTDLGSRSVIILNKDAEHNWGGAKFDDIAVCGGVPRYKDTNVRNIANAVSRLDMWNSVQTI